MEDSGTFGFILRLQGANEGMQSLERFRGGGRAHGEARFVLRRRNSRLGIILKRGFDVAQFRGFLKGKGKLVMRCFP